MCRPCTRAYGLLFLLLSGASLGAGPIRLVPGVRVLGSCVASRPATFRLALAAGVAAQINLDQGENDLVVRIATAGLKPREVDGFSFGLESVTVVASDSGVYSIQIVPAARSAARVRFSIVATLIPHPGSTETQWIRAEDLATESRRVARDTSAWEHALDMLHLSLEAWTDLGATNLMARTRLKAGDVYFAHGIWECKIGIPRGDAVVPGGVRSSMLCGGG